MCIWNHKCKSYEQGIFRSAHVLRDVIKINGGILYCAHDLWEKAVEREKKKERREAWVTEPPTGLSFCIKGTCRIQSRQWWGRWRWWWRRRLLRWFCWWTLIRADRVDPECLKPLVTFLRNSALLVALEHVLTAAAAQSFSLQQFIHPLDDALQTLIHVHPHLLLRAREQYGGYLVYIHVTLR